MKAKLNPIAVMMMASCIPCFCYLDISSIGWAAVPVELPSPAATRAPTALPTQVPETKGTLRQKPDDEFIDTEFITNRKVRLIYVKEKDDPYIKEEFEDFPDGSRRWTVSNRRTGRKTSVYLQAGEDYKGYINADVLAWPEGQR